MANLIKFLSAVALASIRLPLHMGLVSALVEWLLNVFLGHLPSSRNRAKAEAND